MIKLYTIKKYVDNDGLKIAVVKNPFICDNFNHMEHKNVMIDDIIERVIAVERMIHTPPWLEGETIALKMR